MNNQNSIPHRNYSLSSLNSVSSVHSVVPTQSAPFRVLRFFSGSPLRSFVVKIAVLCLLTSVFCFDSLADEKSLPVKVRNSNYKLVDGKRFKDRTAKTNAVDIITYAISIDADSEIYMTVLRQNLLHKIGAGDVDGAIALLETKSRTLSTKKPAPKFRKQK
ncbi:hypothetical protein P4B35_08735 [Pontiellaceae bacterium B12227]|nr:hypothetical protein [Pontiellaceae bacterium B12227]